MSDHKRYSTLDGSNPVNSPVEVGSLSHYLQGSSTIPGGWEWDFSHQQYDTHMLHAWNICLKRLILMVNSVGKYYMEHMGYVTFISLKPTVNAPANTPGPYPRHFISQPLIFRGYSSCSFPEDVHLWIFQYLEQICKICWFLMPFLYKKNTWKVSFSQLPCQWWKSWPRKQKRHRTWEWRASHLLSLRWKSKHPWRCDVPCLGFKFLRQISHLNRSPPKKNKGGKQRTRRDVQQRRVRLCFLGRRTNKVMIEYTI